MRHIRPVSGRRPFEAQFESLLQLIGLLSAALALVEQIFETFGIPIPQKDEKAA